MAKQSDSTTLVDGVLAAAAHLEPELEEALAEHRLSRPSFQVLSALLDAEGHALTQRELMARVRRTSGTVSVRLARLERAGLVTREPDAEDRRSVTVTLTDSGRELAEAARPAYAEAATRLAAGLPDDARATFAEQLDAWLGFFEPDDGVAPRLGVAVAPAAVASRMRRAVGLPDRHGILVLKVKRSSAADAAGLARGDLVTGAGGVVVRTIGAPHGAPRPRHARARRRARRRRAQRGGCAQPIFLRSMSKIRGSLGPIFGGDPCWP
jgi:DNA-binding MarR family transcriptional regulator